MRAVLALDQGTTSSRAILFDVNGSPIATAQREFPQIFPQPGWVEHDPEAIWTSQYVAACEALERARLTAADVVAIGITNQRETTLLWDRRTGAPLYNAIVWQDRRTAGICERLRAAAELVTERTGLVLDPYFSATKIAWLLDTVPGLRERADAGEIAFGTVDSWLVWRMTGGTRHVTDVTNASRTMLFNIHSLAWDRELLDVFGVPDSLLPEVLPSAAKFGVTKAELFGAPIRIGGVAGDQQAALIGQAGLTTGLAKNTYGTGSFVMLNTGENVVTSRSGLLSTIAYAFEPRRATYALEGAVFVTGAAVQWLRDGLHLFERASDIEPLARESESTHGLYFVPAFTGLGAPYWDPNARGTILGITRGTTRTDLARAALEAIAFQCAEVIQAMQNDSGVPLRELRVDGGGSVNDLCMQIQADVLGTSVVRPEIVETTALGAAYLAGLQTGFWESVDSLATHWREQARFEPSIDAARRRELMRGWQRAVARARNWAES